MSLLCRLPHYDLAVCQPFEAMHGLFLNVAKLMALFWAGSFFSNEKENLNDDNTSAKKKDWMEVGADMLQATASIPSAFGGTLRSIAINLKSFKAAEMQEWVLMYSMPLLQGRLPAPLLRHWAYFVRGTQLALKVDGLSAADVAEIKKCFKIFSESYET